MNVVNPNDTTHEITIVPRFYPTGAVVLNLYNEAKQTNENITNSYTVINGKMLIEFENTFIEGENFQIKITENNEVVYRGKLFATSQEPQDYKLTNNVYYY